MAKEKDILDVPETESVGLTSDLSRVTSESGEHEDDSDNPSGDSSVGSYTEKAVTAALDKVPKPKASDSLYQSSLEDQSPRTIATRMGLAPGNIRETMDPKTGRMGPKWNTEKAARGGAITDVRFKPGTTLARSTERLPSGTQGPVLPLTNISKSQFNAENVEVFDRTETIATGSGSSRKEHVVGPDDVVVQQAVKQAAKPTEEFPNGRAYTREAGNPVAPGVLESGRSKYDMSPEELEKEGLTRSVYAEPPADSSSRGPAPTGTPMRGSPVSILPSPFRTRKVSRIQFAEENEPDTTVDSGPLTDRAPASDPRGGHRAIRARMEEAAPAIKNVREPVRAEIERAEMFTEDPVAALQDSASGVGFEPRDPENLERGGRRFYRAAAGGADKGGISMPKYMMPGEGAGTPGVSAPEGEEVEAPKTQDEAILRMGGAGILAGAAASGQSLETPRPPAEGETEARSAIIDIPGVRGTISDVGRIKNEAAVQGVPVGDMDIAALTALSEQTDDSIRDLMRPDLIGTSVSGQVGTSGTTGVTEVRKIQKGGDEAARAREARNQAFEMTATQFKKLKPGIAGPVLPMTRENVEAAVGKERARRSQAEGSFPTQSGEQGREGRRVTNSRQAFTANQAQRERESNEAANRALGLAGPGGGTVPAPRSVEERRGGGRRQQ